jgi:hypothetical protein
MDGTITARTFAASAGASTIGQAATIAGGGLSSGSLPAETSSGLPLISLAVGAGAAVESLALVSAEGADLEASAVLGEGGMGRVLLARQRSLQRDVAVKLLKQDVASVEVVQSLLSEALVTGALEHPNIIPVHALGRDGSGQPLLVMKRVEGVSWRTVLRASDHPAWARLLERSGDKLVASVEVLMAVCNALAFAHARGVIHRDIKPENVMLGSFGEVYLVDWGIALRPDSPRRVGLVGTPSYLAPEMLDGDPARVDPRTDVYLLGATLHEVLTGAPRHAGATLYEAMISAYDSAPYAYSDAVPPELSSLANESCARDPSERPASAEAFRQRLAEWLRHRGAAELARDTAQRARALTALSARASDGDVEARRAFDRLATECRFGFVEALRQWPESAVAREGLRACLRAMASVELARDNPDGARSLLDELGEDDPVLRAALAEASAKRAARDADAARGREVAHEFNEQVSSRERTVFLGALGTIAVGVMTFIRVRGGVQGLSVQSAARLSVIALGGMALVAFFLRRNLAANAFNRRVTAVVFVSMAAMVGHRWTAFFRGDTSLPNLLGDDLWTISAITALAAVTIQRWFAWVALVFAASAVAINAAPLHSPVLFTVGPVTAMLLALLLHRRDVAKARDSAREQAEPR